MKMTMKTIIKENERGLLFKNGKYQKVLMPGRYYTFGSDKSIVVCDVKKEFKPAGCELAAFEKDAALTSMLAFVDVPDESIALHFANGRFVSALTSGRYAFWNIFDRHEFTFCGTSDPEISPDIPKYVFSKIPSGLFSKIEVAQYQKARLYYDQCFIKLLDEGTYYFWNNGMKIDVGYADTRLRQMDIAGQEMLTLDKVAVRINFVCHYKIADYVKIFTEIENYEQQIHVTLQLALRDYIGRYRLDEILETKEQISEYALGRLREKEDSFYIKVADAGIKDIILPGEIREIMNTVLIAEKRAQANVITRREEVASTRSLLNTAKLMDENKTLYKLKELEYIEKICENVGSITVNGSTDLLSQLTTVLKGT